MTSLRVAVLGAGNIGGTLGRKWIADGHQVRFGVTDPASEKANALRAQLGGAAHIGTVAEALADAEVVLLAIPGNAMEATIQANAAALDGKILIDAANRLGGGGPANSLTSFQAHTPHANVYRAFNTLGWENFAEPVIGGIQADLFYAGPDGEPRATVEQLISDVGLRPIYVGGTDQFGLVDSVLALWFQLARGRNIGRRLAFKVLTPSG